MTGPGRITLRAATDEDAATVHRLLTALAAATGKGGEISSTVDDIARFGFGPEPVFHCILAWLDGEAVGLSVFFPEFSTWKGCPGVYVQDLYVDRRLRGQGLGRRLLDATRDRAAGWGARYVKLAVHGENPAAVAFYRRLGFEPSRDEQVLVLRY